MIVKDKKSAERDARKLMAVMERLTHLKKEKENIEGGLREYVQATGDTIIGPVKAYERTSSTKLCLVDGSSATKENLEYLKNDLVGTGCLKISIDVSKLKVCLEKKEEEVSEVMRKHGIIVRMVKEWYFKHV